MRYPHTFYVVGLGSMGKRRIRNLNALGIPASRIHGYDPEPLRRKEAERKYRISTASDFKKGFQKFKPSALIISTPPDKHATYFLFAARRKVHFFVEVTTVDDGYRALMPLLGSFVAAPSATFRYVAAVKKIREIFQSGDIGKPFFFQHYLGQYLPDWHPYENYSNVYFAKRKTGGAREMFPHELQWLSYIFNSSVEKATGIVAKISELKMSADDVYSVVVQYRNKIVGSINIDLLNRKATRNLRVVGSKGVLEWDWLKNAIVITKQGTTNRITLPREKKFGHYNSRESIYIAEMRDFLYAIEGKKPYPHTFREDRDNLDVLYSVERQSRSLKKIQ